jgi:molybdate transport system substrate-binding protein
VRLRATLLALAASTVLAGCGGSPDPAGTSPGPTGEITVMAAASLTDVFQQLGGQFEQANPTTTITFSFGASSALATQIEQGAPADVFASASPKNMDAVIAANAASSSTPFTRNVMAIAVPPSNPGKITQLSDLAGPGIKVALCQAQVPCGAAAATVFANAGLSVTPVTEETDVKAALAKVILGEVDAGVVYATDVRAAGEKVTAIEIPRDVNASTSYPIATLTAAKNPALAKAFVDYVLSTDGADVLTGAGFERP